MYEVDPVAAPAAPPPPAPVEEEKHDGGTIVAIALLSVATAFACGTCCFFGVGWMRTRDDDASDSKEAGMESRASMQPLLVENVHVGCRPWVGVGA